MFNFVNLPLLGTGMSAKLFDYTTRIMKIKSLFASVMASVMAFVACEQERDFVLPKLKLGASEITFSMYGGDTTLMVEATRDWTVNIDEETAKWLVISPSSGKASATPEEVIVAVLANEGYGREATVSFSTGIQTRDLTVKQDGGLGAPAVTDGDGTKANPYSASKAQEVAAALGQDDKVTGVYAKGIVKSVKEISTDFGNATYYLTDEAGKADFYVYRGRGLGNAKFTSADELKAGDKVVIYGDLMNYMGNSPQFGQGNYIVELNGVANDPNGNDTPGGGTSDGSAIYSNNFDKTAAAEVEGQGWPFPDKSDVWKNEAGSGVSNVTYASSNVTVRNNANSNGTYSDYAGSGVNNLFFGKTPAYFAVKSIALGSTTSLELTFGTEKYSKDNGSVFTNSEFHIWLSNDGSKWVELTDYVFAGGTTEGRWNLAKANFSVPAGTANLSICLSVDAASSYRVDDLKLVASTPAGTAVDFSAAVEKDFNSGATAGGNTGGDNTGGDNTGGDNTGGDNTGGDNTGGDDVPVSANHADFETLTGNSSYISATTTAGWTITSCAVQIYGTENQYEKFAFVPENTKAVCMNGKTSAVGTIESPLLAGGCGTLSLSYAAPFTETNGVSFKIEVIQGGNVVKTINVENSSAAKLTAYDFTAEVNVDGEFKLKLTNNSPSQSSDKNKDRYSVWNLKWTNTAK